ncbi:hypothetical protein Gpo141_00010881 [Globisporangium polare]
MLTSVKTVQLACVAAMVAVASVEGHGYMSVPKATFAISGDPTQFCATMFGPSTLTAPAGKSFSSDPASNAAAFTEAFKAQSKYASLKDLINTNGKFISGANKECGVTSPTGAKQPLPATYVEWAHSNEEGFTPSHQGPCEVWCDDKLAFSNDNCPKNYATAPAKLPYDKSKCTGASMLKFYWLALHSDTWQAYIACAPLLASSGGSASSPVVSPSTTPKATAKTPASTTSAPTKATTSAPKATTKAPVKATPSKQPETGADAGDDCELSIPNTKKPETGADADADCELDIPGATKKPETGADADCELDIPGKPSATPKAATKAPTKTPAATDSAKQTSRSMEYGFDALDDDN